MRFSIILTLGASLLVNALSINTSGRCGAQFNGLTCKGSTLGDCCSEYGYCGTTTGHCGSGCQTGFGVCTTSSPPAIPKVSTDGSCGGSKGLTCQGSAFGNCCSQYGYCGKSSSYCSGKCNAKFGTCSSLTAASSLKAFGTTTTQPASSSKPVASQKVSTEGRCGNTFGASGGMTCASSKFGQCCSQYSYWYVIARLNIYYVLIYAVARPIRIVARDAKVVSASVHLRPHRLHYLRQERHRFLRLRPHQSFLSLAR
jgi:hypothetical protein